MSLSLQEALRKLREAKQSEQAPQAKRAAVASEDRNEGSNGQQSTSIDDMLDFDMDAEIDMFDGLMPDDSDLATLENSGAPAVIESQTTRQNGILIQPTPPANSVAENATPSHKEARDAPLQHKQGHATPSRATPAGSPAIASTTSHTRTVTTTLVHENSRQSSVAARRRQEIPGPAGIVSDAQQRAVDLTDAVATQRPTSLFKTPLSRTRTSHLHGTHTGDVDFEGGTWMAMLDHLGVAEYNPAVAKTAICTVSAAEWPIRKVLDLPQSQKVRIMLLQFREIAVADSDASAVVVDPTGEMKASIHYRVMKRFGEYLGAGTSVILKDVVALKLAGTRPFLVVTEETIEQIFTEKAAGAPSNPIAISDTQHTAAVSTQRPGDQEQVAANAVSTPDQPAAICSQQQPSGISPVERNGAFADDDNFADDDGVDTFMDLLDPPV
ncbi:hypothetical protein GGI23_000489 [Coemansia sp. RSA 2559]|nr:hypothetical protein GGI23_000489 [Coemansia sp. RSA 2559]KAJ2869113.1 hypothetical protein GGI22_000455 [Coemansia erecta]